MIYPDIYIHNIIILFTYICIYIYIYIYVYIYIDITYGYHLSILNHYYNNLPD